jgi:pseudaminic acid biosynthesis-associated methylase
VNPQEKEKMGKTTKQIERWCGQFGREYTDRNALSLEELEKLYERNFGISRTKMNSVFIGDMARSMRILEVGSNIGNQLACLQKMGFTNLYAIELQTCAAKLSKLRTRNINIIQGSAFNIPCRDGFFDLIFTSGLLIHICPADIDFVLDEIYRCTRKYIWGFEYYADCLTEVNYRGETELLWKTNFVKLYHERFPNLRLVKEERFKYLENDNLDAMFLLEKRERELRSCNETP